VGSDATVAGALGGGVDSSTGVLCGVLADGALALLVQPAHTSVAAITSGHTKRGFVITVLPESLIGEHPNQPMRNR